MPIERTCETRRETQIHPRRYVTTMSNSRIWSPFVIAYVGGMVTLIFETPIGDYLGMYSPLFGYAGVGLYAGALLGFVAALASRSGEAC